MLYKVNTSNTELHCVKCMRLSWNTPRHTKMHTMFRYICYIVLILDLAALSYGKEMLVCRSISEAFSDADTSLSDCKVYEERIKSLEEQVRQLQSVFSSGEKTSNRSRYDGIPGDCSEIFDSGITKDGVHIISPDGKCPLKVYCDMTNGGWTMIQKRLDGSVSFYREWDEYVAGFGDIDGNHWLGLDKIHRLTKDGTQIYFDIENYDGTKEHAHYRSFTVHDVTTAYRMNVDAFGYEGTLKELLSYHNNQKFSTFDSDNDEHSSNCCEGHDGGGWWYKSCSHFNVNGVYGKKDAGGICYLSGGVTPIKNINLKIKRRRGMC